MIHQVRLGQDLAEHHIQHRTAGKTKAQSQTQRADLAQHIAQKSAQHRGDTGCGCDQHRLPFGHTAADQGNRNRHTLGNIVQTDQYRQNQRRITHNTVVAGIGRTDGHALRHIVQGDGAGHDDASHKQTQLAVLAGIVLLKVVAVDQLIQIVSRLGVFFIDMRHFRIGLFVDQVIQKIGNGHTEGNCAHNCPDAHLGFDGFRDQIKAHHAQHNTAGKA